MPVNDRIQIRKGTLSEWVASNPVLASGEPGYDITNNLIKIGDGVNPWTDLPLSATSDVYVYAKNTTTGTLYKGQAVYINGAIGNNPTLELAIATGDATSSKTIGLLKQNLAINEFGYVVAEGILDQVDTNGASSAGDPIWLSPTTPGGLLYGTANKPYAPNHLVFLGYVLRKQLNAGKIYVKIQNGYELEELHNVAVTGATNGQFLQYNSVSGLWVPSSSGNFTTLQVNGTGVTINGHTHTSSQITDFNNSVSGLINVKNIIAGTNINISSADGIFTINSTASGGSGSISSEEIMDIVGSGLVGGSGININYNDTNNIITISLSSVAVTGYEILTESKNVFTVSPGYIPNNINVYYNGFKLLNGEDYTATNGSTFTLNGVTASGDVVEWAGISEQGIYSPINHTHISSQITDFNSSVSGLLPVTNILAGTGISVSSVGGVFTINNTGIADNTSSISDIRLSEKTQAAVNLYLWQNFR